MPLGFAPSSFFPPVSTRSALSGDVRAIARQAASVSASCAPLDPIAAVDLSVLVGPHHSCKTRLLLQLAYNLASHASPTAVAQAGGGGVDESMRGDMGDPFQPVVLILPRRRNLTDLQHQQQQQGATSRAATAKPILGLFGAANLQTEVLNKIQIKWYENDSELHRIVCHLHQFAASSPSNISGVPPRFVGIMYDSKLNLEAARVVLVLARLCEALVAMRVDDLPFAPCQALFVMSTPTSVPRLQSLLPRYARAIFEITPGPGAGHGGSAPSSWLLHSRPMANPTNYPLSTINKLVQPMAALDHASDPPPQQQNSSTGGGKISPRSLPLGQLVGIPVLQYQVTTESVDLVGIQRAEK